MPIYGIFLMVLAGAMALFLAARAFAAHPHWARIQRYMILVCGLAALVLLVPATLFALVYEQGWNDHQFPLQLFVYCLLAALYYATAVVVHVPGFPKKLYTPLYWLAQIAVIPPFVYFVSQPMLWGVCVAQVLFNILWFWSWREQKSAFKN